MKNLIDCCDQPGQDSLSAEQARNRICESVEAVDDVTQIILTSALRRVLAEDINSLVNVPGHTNSAVDGYAFDSRNQTGDVQESGLTLCGAIMAGEVPGRQLKAGECMRIMTGAIMPDGADTVLMQEYADISANTVHSDQWPNAGANVRLAGEDIRQGDLVLQRGTHLKPAEIGLLASLGCNQLAVNRPLKIAVISTGDEVRAVDQSLAAGEVYDSNRFTLRSLLSDSDCEVMEMGIVEDRHESLRRAFEEAAAGADMIISSAGVSVGDADYTRQVLDTMGNVDFWKLAIKPGRPLAFGHIGNTVFFGLPGNPVAVMVTYLQFVLPAIRRMQGITNYQPLSFKARAESEIHKKKGRTEFCRGIFRQDTDDIPRVNSTGAQGSGILSSMSRANCFICLAENQGNVAIGDEVVIQPFSGFF